MATASFDSLVVERDVLRNYVLVHANSLQAFKQSGRPWFRPQQALDKPDKSGRKVRHLTTTASCLESLADVPTYGRGDPPPSPPDAEKLDSARKEMIDSFAKAVLSAKPAEWKSEGGARVYSRVRTLPVLLRLAEERTLKQHKGRLREHLQYVWDRLDIADSRRQAVAEEGEGEKSRQDYPPNAFHTYWAIRFLREYRARGLVEPGSDLREREAVAQLWARRTLATQTALISGKQAAFDAHQLAWALSTDVLCRANSETDLPTTADHQHIELYDAALEAFFSEQHDGRWRLYEPLFHYLQAGNAYCYTYETLAELLRLALRQEQGRVLRDHLRGYSQDLIDVWHYARKTALKLEGNSGVGWCSGHHPHRTHPEAWATASVFSYLQNLRCLIGHWTSEEAKQDLAVRPSRYSSKDDGRKKLADRGTTWRFRDSQTVGRQIAMLFLHPIEATARQLTLIDPDRPLVSEARSAVLFGPPGTSKTTLVGSLAAALGWDFLEIHASDFLSEGLDSVPAQADSIFRKLMELDHCVVLFDEIDELIRLRKESPDPFGRFLTTSMLPKLAKLWDQRRVLFFVATNDIEAADPAIKRSQRFDAAIFVPPPSFEKKKNELAKHLDAPPAAILTRAGVDEALVDRNAKRPFLGVFAMLRWDQIAELAHRIMALEQGGAKPAYALRDALKRLGRELASSDWRQSEPNHPRGEVENVESEDGDPENDSFREMYKLWNRQRNNERRDYRDAAVMRLAPGLVGRVPKTWERYGANNEFFVIGAAVESDLGVNRDGAVTLTGGDWKAVDRLGLFSFERP